jgi:two-component system cell cycle response regulator DivK
LKSSAGQENGGPIKALVLLAEDHKPTAELSKMILGMFGYKVTLAHNGIEAVEKAVAELPDVIVMDVHMPVMDGLQAAARIRNHPRTQSIPILAATAKAMLGDKEKCLVSGCDDYIAKPFTHTQLVASIEKLLNKAAESG